MPTAAATEPSLSRRRSCIVAVASFNAIVDDVVVRRRRSLCEPTTT